MESLDALTKRVVGKLRATAGEARPRIQGNKPDDSDLFRMAIMEPMAEEREECAKIADKSDKAIGEAIRARGKMFSTG